MPAFCMTSRTVALRLRDRAGLPTLVVSSKTPADAIGMSDSALRYAFYVVEFEVP